MQGKIWFHENEVLYSIIFYIVYILDTTNGLSYDAYPEQFKLTFVNWTLNIQSCEDRENSPIKFFGHKMHKNNF